MSDSFVRHNTLYIFFQADYALDYGEAPTDDYNDTVDTSPSVTMISKRPLEGAAVAYEDYDNPSTAMYTGKH